MQNKDSVPLCLGTYEHINACAPIPQQPERQAFGDGGREHAHAGDLLDLVQGAQRASAQDEDDDQAAARQPTGRL